MRRFRWHPDLADNVRALLLVAFFVGLLGVGVVFYGAPFRHLNTGFGPEWECTPQVRGEPTCIKRIGR